MSRSEQPKQPCLPTGFQLKPRTFHFSCSNSCGMKPCYTHTGVKKKQLQLRQLCFMSCHTPEHLLGQIWKEEPGQTDPKWASGRIRFKLRDEMRRRGLVERLPFDWVSPPEWWQPHVPRPRVMPREWPCPELPLSSSKQLSLFDFLFDRFRSDYILTSSTLALV